MHNSSLGLCRQWRRGLLPCLVLIASLALSSAVFAQHGVAHLRVRQTASQSLTLIKPTSPDFESTLDTYFPGLSEVDGYQQAIRPFLVIVRNDRSQPAAAYAIVWTEHYADGSVRSRRAVYVNRPLLPRGAMTYLPPGDIRLISPMFNVTPDEYERYSSPAQFSPASSFPPSQGLASVDANVDGVVYTDGTFIGPDKTRVLQRYVMSKFAARDEALSALDLINSSTAPPLMIVGQLEKMFSKEFQWELEAYQHTLLALYVKDRGSTAMDLRRILQSRGLAGLEKLLQNFVNRSGGNTNPSMFGKAYGKLSSNDPRVFGIVPWRPKGP